MKILLAGTAALAMMTASAASAAVYTVGALANSSTGGVGLPTLSLALNQSFSVSVATTDLWSAGELPRWSNANGLTGNLLATGSDESGELALTLIGTSYGNHTQNALSAPFGALVGELGGVYQLLGTSYTGAAWAAGTLNLYYWDSNAADNIGDVRVTALAGAVPEAATWAMMIAGFGLVGATARQRRRNVVTA